MVPTTSSVAMNVLVVVVATVCGACGQTVFMPRA